MATSSAAALMRVGAITNANGSIVRRSMTAYVATASSSSSARANLGGFALPEIKNEPFVHYEPGSAVRAGVRAECDRLRSQTTQNIPCIVNGEEIYTGDVRGQPIPSDHAQSLCTFHYAPSELLQKAIDGTMAAREDWMKMPMLDRAAIFLKAADLLSTKYRVPMLASTMLGQSKTVWQAEVDALVELCDFWRFSAKYMEQIYNQQPPHNAQYQWNRTEYRPLDGFVAAISPFNFTAIGGNLCSAPAIMGNGVVWKPTDTAVHSNYLVYKILEEAGLPAGVIQFTPADGPTFGDAMTKDERLAGVHFTGSTQTFNHLYKQVAANIDHYDSYPKIVGETGGKDFHMVHASADIDNVVASTIRGAFEYQGQKCSATSRTFVPQSRYEEFMSKMQQEMKRITMGQPDDMSSFLSAVIDAKSYARIKKYIDDAKASPDAEVVIGGKCDDSRGFFIEPTVIEAKTTEYASMKEEIFGPVLTVYKYKDADFEDMLTVADKGTKYALTGSIFAQDRYAIAHATERLRFAAGNFYVNDKCTGSIVGQQPFGGSRKSGTNDKSGSMLNLLRWTSARTVSENFVPLTQSQWSYPSVSDKP